MLRADEETPLPSSRRALDPARETELRRPREPQPVDVLAGDLGERARAGRGPVPPELQPADIAGHRVRRIWLSDRDAAAQRDEQQTGVERAAAHRCGQRASQALAGATEISAVMDGWSTETTSPKAVRAAAVLPQAASGADRTTYSSCTS